MQGGSSGSARSLISEIYRIAKVLASKKDNILRLGYDKASTAIQAYVAELNASSTSKHITRDWGNEYGVYFEQPIARRHEICASD